MRKKIFAVIMSAMMMITFMPSMAFAAETAPTNPHFTDGIVEGNVWVNVKYDANTYPINASKVAQGFAAESAMPLSVIAKSETGYPAELTLKAEAPSGITVYGHKTGETNFYDLSTGISGVYLSAGQQQGYDVLPVIKSNVKATSKFDVKLTIGDATKTITFNPASADAVATIGDKYYKGYADVSADAKTGDTIKVLSANAFSTFGNGTRALTFDCVSADAFTAATTVAKGCTLKNANLSADLTLNEGAAAENVKTTGAIKVAGKDVKVTSAEAGTIEVSGSAVFDGKLKTGDVTVKENSTFDISRVAKNDLTFGTHKVTLQGTDAAKAKFIPNDDERWVLNSNEYTLGGVYVCNGKTYIDFATLWNAVSADSNLAVKVIGETSSDSFTLKANQTLTLDGVTGSKFNGNVNTASAGAKLVINSGIYANVALLDASAGAYLNVKEGKSVAKYGDFYYVGKDLILEEVDATSTGAVELKVMASDLTDEDLQAACTNKKVAVASGSAAYKTVMNAWHTIDVTEFMNITPAPQKKEVLGFFILLTDAEAADLQKDYLVALGEMQSATVTAKAKSVTDKSAVIKMTCDVKGAKFLVDGKKVEGNTAVVDLNPATSNTVRVRAYKLVAGKVPAAATVVKVKVNTPPTVKAAKKALKVSYTKQATAKKYQISVSTSKKGTSVKATTKKTSYTVKKLKAKKTYYVKVRIVKANGKKGAWSAVKKIKTK